LKGTQRGCRGDALGCGRARSAHGISPAFRSHVAPRPATDSGPKRPSRKLPAMHSTHITRLVVATRVDELRGAARRHRRARDARDLARGDRPPRGA